MMHRSNTANSHATWRPPALINYAIQAQVRAAEDCLPKSLHDEPWGCHLDTLHVPPKTAVRRAGALDYYADDNWMEGLLAGKSPKLWHPQAPFLSLPSQAVEERL
jgi:hypothetical protein